MRKEATTSAQLEREPRLYDELRVVHAARQMTVMPDVSVAARGIKW